MKSIIAVLVAFVVLLCAVPAFATGAAAEPTYVAKVVNLQGKAYATTPAGVKRELALRGEVRRTETVSTGPNSRVQLCFLDMTIFVMGPEAQLRIEEYVSRGNVIGRWQMIRGQFQMISGNIARQDPNAHQMRTITASIGIRGTVTAHNVTENGEQHYCLDIAPGHSVVVSNADGTNQQVMTNSLEAVDVDPNGGVGEPREMTGDEVSAFESLGEFDAPAPEEQVSGDAGDGTGEGDGTGGEATADGGDAGGDVSTGEEQPAGEMSADGGFDAGLTGDEGFVPPDMTDVLADNTADPAVEDPNAGGTTIAALSPTHEAHAAIPIMSGSGVPLNPFWQPSVTATAAGVGPTLYLNGNGASGDYIVGGGLEPTVVDFRYAAYTWAGSPEPVYFMSHGSYDDGVKTYLEWGKWELVNAPFVFAVGSNSIELPEVFGIAGAITPQAVIAGHTYSGAYTGTAEGVYYNGTTPTYLNGSFSCDVDFDVTDQVSNAQISFPNGLSLNSGSGALNAQGQFNLNFASTTFPGPGGTVASTGEAQGAFFGADAEATAGTWTTVYSNEEAVGTFVGQR